MHNRITIRQEQSKKSPLVSQSCVDKAFVNVDQNIVTFDKTGLIKTRQSFRKAEVMVQVKQCHRLNLVNTLHQIMIIIIKFKCMLFFYH